MASLDGLPADQRAVLQLVLQRGRSYDDIAKLLSIDRAAVRQRALSGLDSLGPQTGVEPEQRALITDYLLGQLPDAESEDTRERLAENPNERAWARVVAAELASISSKPLPEIPVESLRDPGMADEEPDEHGEPEPFDDYADHDDESARVGAASLAAAGAASAPHEVDEASPAAEDSDAKPARGRRGRGKGATDGTGGARRSSRLGGAILLGISAIVVIVVVAIIAGSGGGKTKSTSTSASNPTSTPTTSATSPQGTSSTGTSTTPKVIHQINLTSPSGNSQTAGLADVLRQGAVDGIAIIAQHVPPNTKHDAYAVWLYNSPTDSHILGFVNPGVGSNGRLSTAGALPTNASHYKQLIVTLETQANPRSPGKIVLQGPLAFS